MQKEEGYVASDDEKQFEALNSLARQCHSPSELINNEPMFLPTLLRLFESEKTMVRNSSIKLFASMPDKRKCSKLMQIGIIDYNYIVLCTAEWLDFIEADNSLHKHLPAILANFYSFATHPERPYGRQYVFIVSSIRNLQSMSRKAISLHVRCLPLIRSHFGATHPLSKYQHLTRTI